MAFALRSSVAAIVSVPPLQRLIARAETATEAGERATLTLALDYGGRWDVAQVTRSIALDLAAGVIQPDDIMKSRFRRDSPRRIFQILICVSGRQARPGSLIFCFGSSLMPSSGLLRCCGQILMRRCWISLWLIMRCGSGALVCAPCCIVINGCKEAGACSGRG